MIKKANSPPKETRQDTWTLHKRKSTNGQKTHEENDQ